jgi:hypothetical protein
MKTLMLFAIPALLAVSEPRPASAQVQVVIEPPAAYIATAEPEYFESRPVYYYNNYWYYRDHGHWRYYRNEPYYLRERRAHWGERRWGEHRWERGPERRWERPGYDRRPTRYYYRR